MNPAARLIMYHKQATSARTRFLRLEACGVCGFEPLPPLSRRAGGGEEGVVTHPASLVREAEQRLGLAAGGLEVEPGFHHRLESPDGTCTVYLARFTAIDPPFDAAEQAGGRFVAITEARDLPPVQLDLLRDAYEVIMEG